MKQVHRRARLIVLAAVTLLGALIGAVALPASAQTAYTPRGAGHSSGLMGLSAGQSVRVSVVNVGGNLVHGESVFVPVFGTGKTGAPLRSTWAVASGDAQSDVFTYPVTGGLTVQFYVQVRGPGAIRR